MTGAVTVQAFLLADLVLKEADSKKVSIVGVFDAVNADTIPVVIPRGYLFAKVRGLDHGDTVQFCVARASGELVSVLPPIPIPENFAKPVFQAIVDISGLQLDQLGEYVVQMLVNDAVLAQTPLSVGAHQRPSATMTEAS